jgi:hypothetical protein
MPRPPKPPPNSIPAERLDAYDRLIATHPGVQRKGAKIPYTSLNGHMTSYLTDTGSLVLRLSPADRERFLREFETGLHVAYGTVQKEFVDVPDPLLADAHQLVPWFAASHAWVATLKPKPTRRGG